MGYAGKAAATWLKKRSNPSGVASETQQSADHNSLQNNNKNEGTQKARHSLYSTKEISKSSLLSNTLSSIQGNGHLPKVERNTSIQCDSTLNQCDGSLKPESKSMSGNVDLKTSFSDAIQTNIATSNSDGCDASSLDLVDNNHNSNHSRLGNSHDSTTNSKCSSIAVHPEDDLAAKPALDGELDVRHMAVFFVDYGDYALVPSADFCDLRTDFLSLSHQAFLVHLAGVVPV